MIWDALMGILQKVVFYFKKIMFIIVKFLRIPYSIFKMALNIAATDKSSISKTCVEERGVLTTLPQTVIED